MQPVHENRLALRRLAAENTVSATPLQQLLQSRQLVRGGFGRFEDSVFG
jgi:hypothetical protein